MANQKKLKISFVGDVCLSLNVLDVMKKQGDSFPFEYLKSVLHDTDINVANLECCFSDESSVDNRRRMTVPSSVATNFFKKSGFHILGLANNHIMDGGPKSLENTIGLLTREGIPFFGAGKHKAEAESILYYDFQGVNIAYFGACDVSKFDAKENNPGVAPWNEKRLIEQVETAKKKASIIVVVLHGDLEFTEAPQPNRIKLARRLADAGANLVIQHHPHVVQGVEHYKNSVIAYSLGNCVFQVKGNHYQELHQGTDLGIALVAEFDIDREPKLSGYEVRPFRVGAQHCPEKLDSVSLDNWKTQFARLNSFVEDDKSVQALWHKRVRAEANRRFGDIYWAMRRMNFKLVLKELHHLIRSPEERRWLAGFFASFIK